MMSKRLEIVTDGAFDAATWDAWVHQDARGHMLQGWAWGELKAAFGWTPARVAVVDGGAFCAGAQILYRRLGPLSSAYIPKGPVLASDAPGVWDVLWRGVHARSRRMRAVSLKVEPEWTDDEAARHAMLCAGGFRPALPCVQPRRTIIVGLDGTEDEILARMKSKWRYNIRLSVRKGVEVRQGHVDDLPDFYDLMGVTGERDGFAIHSADYYRRAYELYAPQGQVALFLAYSEGELLAGLMAYAFNRQAWYMYGASSDVKRNLMPNHLLQWRAMCWAKSLGCTQYDLWGIPDSEEDPEAAPLGGVGRFKGGFGGRIVRYVGAYDYVYSRPLYWAQQRILQRRASR